MASSKTEISNISLSHLGVGKEIANLETENSQEAAACRRFYDTALEATIRDFPWTFTNKYAALALVEEDPNDEWAYSYRYPTGCLFVKKILSGVRVDTRQTRVQYEVASDDAGKLIYTDMDDAQINYSALVEDTQFYPSDFVMAFSLRLASLIAPRVTAGDPFKLKNDMLKLYEYELSKARANNFNEEQDPEDPDSEFIRERS